MASSWKHVADQLGVRTLSARSLVLSTLLGLHPPRLPAQALVAMGELFDVSGGTIRTALSRMAADGELFAGDGTYTLSESFARRQRALDAGRQSRRGPWDGSWWAAIVLSERRPMADRRAFRSEMARTLMGELRPEVWLRPANIPVTIDDADVMVTRGDVGVDASHELVASLWDRDGLAAALSHLVAESKRAHALLSADGRDALAESFIVSVACARALSSEPQLPVELVGVGWPADDLRRAAYDALEQAHRRTLQGVLDNTA